MARYPGADDFLPEKGGLPALRSAAAGCRGCDLYREATQTVFGEGNRRARIVMVGEQPGDQEDRQGRPFVGPAGGLLDKALRELKLDPAEVYLTNAVKHFKFVPPERGKRRIHKKPTHSEALACRPWLDAELRTVKPEILVCLGATAAKELLGGDFRVSRQRGALLELPEALADATGLRDCRVLATVHPSSVLRGDDEDRAQRYDGLLADLRVAVEALG